MMQPEESAPEAPIDTPPLPPKMSTEDKLREWLMIYSLPFWYGAITRLPFIYFTIHMRFQFSMDWVAIGFMVGSYQACRVVTGVASVYLPARVAHMGGTCLSLAGNLMVLIAPNEEKIPFLLGTIAIGFAETLACMQTYIKDDINQDLEELGHKLKLQYAAVMIGVTFAFGFGGVIYQFAHINGIAVFGSIASFMEVVSLIGYIILDNKLQAEEDKLERKALLNETHEETLSRDDAFVITDIVDVDELIAQSRAHHEATMKANASGSPPRNITASNTPPRSPVRGVLDMGGMSDFSSNSNTGSRRPSLNAGSRRPSLRNHKQLSVSSSAYDESIGPAPSGPVRRRRSSRGAGAFAGVDAMMLARSPSQRSMRGLMTDYSNRSTSSRNGGDFGGMDGSNKYHGMDGSNKYHGMDGSRQGGGTERAGRVTRQRRPSALVKQLSATGLVPDFSTSHHYDENPFADVPAVATPDNGFLADISEVNSAIIRNEDMSKSEQNDDATPQGMTEEEMQEMTDYFARTGASPNYITYVLCITFGMEAITIGYNLAVSPIYITEQFGKSTAVIGVMLASGAAFGTCVAISMTLSRAGKNFLDTYLPDPNGFLFGMAGISFAVLLAAIPVFPIHLIGLLFLMGFNDFAAILLNEMQGSITSAEAYKNIAPIGQIIRRCGNVVTAVTGPILFGILPTLPYIVAGGITALWTVVLVFVIKTRTVSNRQSIALMANIPPESPAAGEIKRMSFAKQEVLCRLMKRTYDGKEDRESIHANSIRKSNANKSSQLDLEREIQSEGSATYGEEMSV